MLDTKLVYVYTYIYIFYFYINIHICIFSFFFFAKQNCRMLIQKKKTKRIFFANLAVIIIACS